MGNFVLRQKGCEGRIGDDGFLIEPRTRGFDLRFQPGREGVAVESWRDRRKVLDDRGSRPASESPSTPKQTRVDRDGKAWRSCRLIKRGDAKLIHRRSPRRSPSSLGIYVDLATVSEHGATLFYQLRKCAAAALA